MQPVFLMSCTSLQDAFIWRRYFVSCVVSAQHLANHPTYSRPQKVGEGAWSELWERVVPQGGVLEVWGPPCIPAGFPTPLDRSVASMLRRQCTERTSPSLPGASAGEVSGGNSFIWSPSLFCIPPPSHPLAGQESCNDLGLADLLGKFLLENMTGEFI